MAVVLAAVLSTLAPSAASASPGNAIVPFSGLTSMGPTDDGSSLQPLGFTINYFGNSYSTVYVNANGNLTFGSALSTFTPDGLAALDTNIIAPFFADVDTRLGNTVESGTGTFDGYNAFVVDWPYVGCYDENTSVLDDFQVILIDRPDLGSSPQGDDFQIEFNYDQVQWDAGQASGGDAQCTNAPNADSAAVGFSDSSGSHAYQLPGSQSSGAFLDTNPLSGLIYNDFLSDTAVSVPPSDTPVQGRYIFDVIDGMAGTPTSLSTSLSGGGQSGMSVSVAPETAVTDSATLNGDDASVAGGTVTYSVYSDSQCNGSAIASGGTVPVSNGVVPPSSAVTLSTPGTYYWGVSYSGDNAANQPAQSCTEAETVGQQSPPAAAPTQSPPANAAGWNNTDVTVTWNWTSMVGFSNSQTNCPTSTTSSGEGTIVLTATCTDRLGLSTTATYTVNVDKTPPTIAVAHAPNGLDGWNVTSPVTEVVTANDSGSSLTGSPGCTVDGNATTLTPNGSGSWTFDVSSDGIHAVACSVSDNAGNQNSATDRVMIDTTYPSISLSGPSDGASYLLGSSSAASYSCSDDGGSGLASCVGTVPSGSNIDTSTAGPHSFTVTATDNAGNVASTTVYYTVTKEATTLAAEPQVILFPPPKGTGLGMLTATLTSGNSPVAGRTILFSLGSVRLCSAVTGTNGSATCHLSLLQEVGVLLANRYTATFAGDADYLGSTATSPAIELGQGIAHSANGRSQRVPLSGHGTLRKGPTVYVTINIRAEQGRPRVQLQANRPLRPGRYTLTLKLASGQRVRKTITLK